MKKLIQSFGLLAVLLLLVVGWAYNLVSNMEMYHSKTGTVNITVTIHTKNIKAPGDNSKLKTTFSVDGVRPGFHKLGIAKRSKHCTSVNNTQPINIEAQKTTSVKLRLQCDTKPHKLWDDQLVFLIDSRQVPVLYQVVRDGSEVKPLNDSDFFRDQTKNESRIVFSNEGNVWMLDVANGSLKQITKGGNDRQPDWSPDGSKIAFSRIIEDNREIFVMDNDGSDQQNITNNPAEDVAPGWSPDGMKIAFTSDRDGDKEIFVTYPTTNNIRQLTHNKRTDHFASWSPDGRKIMLIGEGWTGIQHVYLAGFNGRILKQLTSFPGSFFRNNISSTANDFRYSEEAVSNSKLLPSLLKDVEPLQHEQLAQLTDI